MRAIWTHAYAETFGQDDSDWKHRDECIRINFTMPAEDVETGIRIIGEEVSKAYAEK